MADKHAATVADLVRQRDRLRELLSAADDFAGYAQDVPQKEAAYLAWRDAARAALAECEQ